MLSISRKSDIPEKLIDPKKHRVTGCYGISNTFNERFVSVFNASDKFFKDFAENQLNGTEGWIETAKRCSVCIKWCSWPGPHTLSSITKRSNSLSIRFYKCFLMKNLAFIRLRGSKLSILFFSRMVRKLTLQSIAPLHQSPNYQWLRKKSCMHLQVKSTSQLFSFWKSRFNYCSFLRKFSDGLVRMRKPPEVIWISLKPLIKWTIMFSGNNCVVLALVGPC